jgi:hypothetical protein
MELIGVRLRETRQNKSFQTQISGCFPETPERIVKAEKTLRYAQQINAWLSGIIPTLSRLGKN